MKEDAKPNEVIETDSERMGGTPCFAQTRVPVHSLFDFMEAGDSLDEFLDAFPSVTREQAVAVLKLAEQKVLERVA